MQDTNKDFIQAFKSDLKSKINFCMRYHEASLKVKERMDREDYVTNKLDAFLNYSACVGFPVLVERLISYRTLARINKEVFYADLTDTEVGYLEALKGRPDVVDVDEYGNLVPKQKEVAEAMSNKG